MLDWKDLSPRPYKKLDTDPYTKARIILMNGIEVEASCSATTSTATARTTTCVATSRCCAASKPASRST
mgnify:CR=1 FL=1